VLFADVEYKTLTKFSGNSKYTLTEKGINAAE
jgi:hypothetical protein